MEIAFLPSNHINEMIIQKLQKNKTKIDLN
jgi:hypothetical protein